MTGGEGVLLRLLVPLAGPGGPLRARVARVVLLLDAVFMLVYSALALAFKWPPGPIAVGMVIVLVAAVSHRWLLRSDASHDCPALPEEQTAEEAAEAGRLPGRSGLIVGIGLSLVGSIASAVLFVLHLIRHDLQRPERQIFAGSAFLIGLGCLIALIASAGYARTAPAASNELRRVG